MTATTTPTAPAITAGAAPAGLNEAQLLVLKRLDAMREEIATLPRIDPDWLAAERRHEQLARLNGEDV